MGSPSDFHGVPIGFPCVFPLYSQIDLLVIPLGCPYDSLWIPFWFPFWISMRSPLGVHGMPIGFPWGSFGIPIGFPSQTFSPFRSSIDLLVIPLLISLGFPLGHYWIPFGFPWDSHDLPAGWPCGFHWKQRLSCFPYVLFRVASALPKSGSTSARGWLFKFAFGQPWATTIPCGW